VGIFGIPCEKIIGLVNIEGGESRGIIEGLDIAFADNGTNWNIITVHKEIERIGVGSFPLDSMRSRHKPLAMEHCLPSFRILKEIPDLCKPKQSGQ
jgi:hypothetical protein